MNNQNRINLNSKIAYLTRLTYAFSLIITGVVFRVLPGRYLIIGNALIGVGGVFLAFCGLKLAEHKFPKPVKVLNKLLIYVIIIFCFAFATTEGAVIYGNFDADKEDLSADCLIVLGAAVIGDEPSGMLEYRLSAAKEYLLKYEKAICIVSGGKSEEDDISEAECMRRWLVQNGIDDDRIIKEERAKDTYQNIKFSYDIIAEMGRKVSVAVLTGDYHVLRASFMAKVQGYDPVMVSAETENMLARVNYYMREVFALWNRLIFGYETA